jgi:hypothetical protein
MRNLGTKALLFLLASTIAPALVALAWALATGSSQAQQGGMHNCPQAGKWAISVWDGPNGTDTGVALATCGADAVDAAYSLDPQTQSWSRWFARQPGMSTLSTLDSMQGVIALGAIGAPLPTPTPAATPTPWPPPNTPPGSVLSEGQTWYQDGVALTLVSADLRPSYGWNVVFQFRLENLTDLGLVVSLDDNSFEVRNNVGDVFTCMVGSSSFLLNPAEIKTLGEGEAYGDIESSLVTSVTIRILSLSRVRDARWSIPVYH